MNPLVGKHILLREYVISDSHYIHAWRNDRATTRWMGPKFAHAVSIDEVSDSLKRVISSPPTDAVYFAIGHRETREYIGGIDLTSIDWTKGTGVLSIVIGDAANRGRGYGSEAIELLLGHAFKTLQLDRVSLNVAAANQGALRCYRNSGFRPCGRKRNGIVGNGQYSDLIHMDVSAAQFRFHCKLADPGNSEKAE